MDQEGQSSPSESLPYHFQELGLGQLIQIVSDAILLLNKRRIVLIIAKQAHSLTRASASPAAEKMWGITSCKSSQSGSAHPKVQEWLRSSFPTDFGFALARLAITRAAESRTPFSKLDPPCT
jgi:hypothetical protein